MKRSFLFRAVAGLACVLLMPSAAQAADTPDQAAIRATMMTTFDKPESRLQVDPIVVVAGHSLAGWTQGDRGGRAVLKRNPHGQWQITVCGGDGLKEASALALTGMPAATARELGAAVRRAEQSVPAARRALFATFGATIRMDAGGAHPAHTGAPAKH